MVKESFFEEAEGITDALDAEILMHRDAHFGGSFKTMLEYYEKGGRGVQDQFSQERILALSESEKAFGSNLAGLLLSGADAERIARSKKAYRKLSETYEKKDQPEIVRLIADLVLTEEESPEKEIDALVKLGPKAVDALLKVLRSQEFYDPLFPGYGKAPWLAAQVLGAIGDKKALFFLFEMLGSDDLGNDDLVLKALTQIGEPAKEMALRVVKAKPYNYDNEKAALVLISFSEDPEVRRLALELLEDKEVQRQETFADYLILICENLQSDEEKNHIRRLIETGDFSPSLKRDMQAVLKNAK